MRTKLGRWDPGQAPPGRRAGLQLGQKGPRLSLRQMEMWQPLSISQGYRRLISDCLQSARWEPKCWSPLSF